MTEPRLSPWLLRLLRLTLPAHKCETIAGDLAEQFARRARTVGLRAARWRSWRDGIASIAAIRYAAWTRPRAGWSAWRPLTHDLRIAMRRLSARPGFTGLAVMTLALGIGVNTVTFSAVNQAMLRPMPGVRDPGELALIEFRRITAPEQGTAISSPDFQDLRSLLHTADGIAGGVLLGLHVTSPNQETRAVSGLAVEGDYFELLGVTPVQGRLLSHAATGAGSDPSAVVISERLATTLFGGETVVGRTVQINRLPFTVVGVAGGGFKGVTTSFDVDAWVPISAFPVLFRRPAATTLDRSAYNHTQLVARLAPGFSLAALEQDLTAALGTLAESHPAESGRLRAFRPAVYGGIGVYPSQRRRVRDASRMLLAVAGLVGLIACANVANLLLLRGIRLRRDVAVRRALGATRWSVARLHLVESGLIALVGCAVGLAMAHVLGTLLSGHTIVGVRSFGGLVLDVRVLTFLTTITASTVLLFGVGPAVLTSGVAPAALMRRSIGSRGGRRVNLRTGIAALQLAMSMALIVGALLLTRTVRALHAVDLGFEPSGLYESSQYYAPQALTASEAAAVTDRTLAALRAVPEVEAAAAASTGLFTGISGGTRLLHPTTSDTIGVVRTLVTPGYFHALQATMVRGREFIDTDMHRAGGGVAGVLTEQLARSLFGENDPIGRQLAALDVPGGRVTIVGIVRDLRTWLPTGEVDRTLYTAAPRGAAIPDEARAIATTVIMRTRNRAGGQVALLRDAVTSATPGMPRASVIAVEDALESQIGRRGVLLRIVGLTAVLAGLLAAVGLYGVVASSVAERVKEIGIRTALGARTPLIARLVLAQVGLAATLGFSFGLPAAAAVSLVLKSQLWGVVALDPVAYGVGAGLFLVIALGAAVVPVRTALGVAPMVALRVE